MPIPSDYLERVYAGVLGKIIGVYLGRPFEGWSHQRILKELGEINYYVHDKVGVPLVVSDDDITGTFTFVRALEDYRYRTDLTAEQIGQTWLNYIIENKTILWWGGMGMSTEHTAYLRLKRGIPAPASGSVALNGQVVAEQIGSQIFIDSWAMVAPGEPDLTAALATRAASVSHDGEAIHAAVVIAVMESLAFFETDLDILIDAAIKYIPPHSIIFQLIADLRACRKSHDDWHSGLALIHDKYSYEKYGGNCHVIPNHAVVFLGLLWGNDNFRHSLMIANTAGYDTDCNSANVGCLLGIKNGLAGIDAGPDWRGPVADRILMPTADGGRCISDAVIETYQLVNAGMTLAGKSFLPPKHGARFHFELPGSFQGFIAEPRSDVLVENVAGHSQTGTRSLALRFENLSPHTPVRVATQTFISVDQSKAGGYAILASPTLYPSQRVVAQLSADKSNSLPVTATLYLRHYNEKDELIRVLGSSAQLLPGSYVELSWTIPPTDGQPIAEIGIELSSGQRTDGSVYLDSLTWSGTPTVVLKRPEAGGSMWLNAWVDGTQQRIPWQPGTWIQNSGTGLLIQGTREWTNYRISTDITPHMVKTAGIAARVQGMQRYYALLLCNDHRIKLVKMLDGEKVLGVQSFDWAFGNTIHLAIEVVGNEITTWADDRVVFKVVDTDQPLLTGAIGIVCEEGRGKNGPVNITAI